MRSETTTETTFTRKKRVGLNLLEINEGETVFVDVQKYDVFTSKNYPDGIPYFDVVDMKTGEEKRMWIDGGLKGALSQSGGVENAAGLKLEIKKGAQKTITVDDEKVKVNTYEVWELN